jgi:NTE family protein
MNDYNVNIPLYESKLKSILVIGGGGIKGLSALGAITKLKELEIINYPEIFCGTSAGAMICFLLLIGYSSYDIFLLLREIDFTTLFELNLDDIFDNPLIGLSHSNSFICVLHSLIIRKKLNINITFEELYKIYKSKLIITGTCVNDMSLHYFSVDKTPNMQVIKAIQISISMPVVFKPCIYDDKIWIDGGCLNNYPIEIFINNLDDVVGIYLDDEKIEYNQFDEIQTYLNQVMTCILRGRDINKISLYSKQTIVITCKGGVSFDWNITKDEKLLLYQLGYNTVK